MESLKKETLRDKQMYEGNLFQSKGNDRKGSITHSRRGVKEKMKWKRRMSEKGEVVTTWWGVSGRMTRNANINLEKHCTSLFLN